MWKTKFSKLAYRLKRAHTQLERLGFDVRLIDEHSLCLKPVTEDFYRTDNPSRYANLYCTKRKTLKW